MRGDAPIRREVEVEPPEEAPERARLHDAHGAVRPVQHHRVRPGRIRVAGDRANAEVRTVAAGQQPSRDIVELVRGKEGWRVSSLSGASPPSPAP